MRLPTGACSLKIGNRALNSQKLNLCTAQVNPTKNPTQQSRSRRFSSMVKRHIDISLPYSAHNIQHNGLKLYKVEKISKGSLDLIPSPSAFSENSNYGRESLLEVERQNIAGHCQQTFENKKFVDITQQCVAYYFN